MAIVFPAYYKVRNARLQALVVCLRALAVLLVYNLLINLEGYGKKYVVKGTAAVWASINQAVPNLTQYADSQASEPFCSTPHVFDYWYDAAGDERYENHTCIRMCRQSLRNNRCVSPADLVIAEGPDSVLLPTHMHYLTNDVDAVHSSHSHNYFVPTIEAMSLRFSFNYQMPQRGLLSWNSLPTTYVPHSSRADTTTVVIDSEGNSWRTFSAGDDILLSLPDLLLIAGIGSLDVRQPLAGANRMPRASQISKAGPSSRLSGVELSVSVSCTSGHQKRCEMHVESSAGNWVVSKLRTGLQGSDVYKIHGVRVKANMIGSVLLWDWQNFLLNVASSLVFLEVPVRITFFIAVYLCGHMSRIYRKLVFQYFDISKESASMAMRLIEMYGSFSNLEATFENEEGAGYIRKEDLHKSLSHVVSQRKHLLDDEEVEYMTKFCLDSVDHSFNRFEVRAQRCDSSVLAVLAEGLGQVGSFFMDLLHTTCCKKSSDDPAINEIYLDSFAAACSSSDMMSFDDFVKLFDRDRRVGLMEAFFTPMHLRAHFARLELPGGSRGEKTMSRKDSITIALTDMKKLRMEVRGMASSLQAQDSNQDQLISSFAQIQSELQKLKTVAKNENQTTSMAQSNDESAQRIHNQEIDIQMDDELVLEATDRVSEPDNIKLQTMQTVLHERILDIENLLHREFQVQHCAIQSLREHVQELTSTSLSEAQQSNTKVDVLDAGLGAELGRSLTNDSETSIKSYQKRVHRIEQLVVQQMPQQYDRISTMWQQTRTFKEETTAARKTSKSTIEMCASPGVTLDTKAEDAQKSAEVCAEFLKGTLCPAKDEWKRPAPETYVL